MYYDSYKKESWMDRYWPEFSIGIICFLFLLAFVFIATRFEHRIVSAVIISHNVTSDRSGSRTYSTIVRTSDGFVEEKTGLNLYITPVNTKVYIDVYRKKDF